MRRGLEQRFKHLEDDAPDTDDACDVVIHLDHQPRQHTRRSLTLSRPGGKKHTLARLDLVRVQHRIEQRHAVGNGGHRMDVLLFRFAARPGQAKLLAELLVNLTIGVLAPAWAPSRGPGVDHLVEKRTQGVARYLQPFGQPGQCLLYGFLVLAEPAHVVSDGWQYGVFPPMDQFTYEQREQIGTAHGLFGAEKGNRFFTLIDDVVGTLLGDAHLVGAMRAFVDQGGDCIGL